jgi:hypothetical protein
MALVRETLAWVMTSSMSESGMPSASSEASSSSGTAERPPEAAVVVADSARLNCSAAWL